MYSGRAFAGHLIEDSLNLEDSVKVGHTQNKTRCCLLCEMNRVDDSVLKLQTGTCRILAELQEKLRVWGVEQNKTFQM
jgi:hypothetical protein